MAASNPEENLRDEVSCSVCLDYFQDPVSIECGHNFCRSCIIQCWEGLDANLRCPKCRIKFRKRNFRPNRELANLTEVVKEMSLKAVEEPSERVCEKHKEPLKLFCEDDLEPICVVCDRSKDHRSHTVIPLEEAAEVYQEKIQNCLKPLRKELTRIQTLQSKQQEKSRELKEKVEIQRQRIVSDFEELHRFLKEEQRDLLGKLEEEEAEILRELEQNIVQLAERNSSLQSQINELERTCNGTATDLLKKA